MNTFIKNRALILVIFLFYILCFGYYSGTDLGLFPDENQHLGYVIDVTNHGFPDYVRGMSYGTNKLNYLQHPALYYLVAGAVEKFLDLLNISDFKLIRLVNVVISSLTLLTVYFSLKKLISNQFVIFTSLLLIISIPMFVALSSSISNDPLMILGGALIFHALILYYHNSSTSKILYLLLSGGLIVSLTKATGALSVLCILAVFIVFENKKILDRIRSLNKKNYSFIALSLAIIIIYYLSIHMTFGAFFPAPQKDPSDWYLETYPNAHRYSLLDHMSAFYQSNIRTLLIPYGHKSFDDLQLRETMLSFSLVLIPFFSIYITHLGIIKKSNMWQLSFISLFSFLIFITFYFITIHRLNIRTGYPGAMQARYFFAFLPAFSIIYGMAYQNIKNQLVLGLSSVIVITAGLLSIYPAFYPAVSPLISSYYGQSKSDTFYGELTKDRKFEQTFIAKSSCLNSVELNLATFARTNNSNVILEIMNNKNESVAKEKVNSRQLIDNSWAAFSFGYIPLTKGEEYRLKLTSDGSSGNAITWYSFSGKSDYPMYVGTIYGPADPQKLTKTSGKAFVDGMPVNAEFSFRIYNSGWKNPCKKMASH